MSTVHTAVRLDSKLHAKAKKKGLNLRIVLENALREILNNKQCPVCRGKVK